MGQYRLLVLGVAGGAGHVYRGLCSSSFLLLKDEDPFCLVDLGLGVTQALQQQGRTIPDKIIITHNHSDHAGELPVVLRVEQAKGRCLELFSAAPVAERLRTYRLAEHRELLDPAVLAHWVDTQPEQRQRLTSELDITFYPAKHSECCYGFVISDRTQDNQERMLLGYTGDSGFSAALYRQLSQCQVAVYDAREKGNQWHASFAEVEPYLQQGGYVIGHELSPEQCAADLRLLQSGQSIPFG